MDPDRRDTGRKPDYVDSADGASGTSGDTPGGGNPAATGRQPQCSGGFTVIPPNESRLDRTRRIARKEEEELQRWKEANRVTYVHADPERLGGATTLAAAREMQHADLRCSKVQRRLQKEKLDKRRRQEEEEEYQRKKDVQREKAELLEKNKRQEEQCRTQRFSLDQARKTEEFLQRFERMSPRPPASGGAAQASHNAADSEPGAESKGARDVQQDHRRVNQAFLDRLEGRRPGGEQATGERPLLAPEDFRHQPPDLTRHRPLPPAVPDAGPDHGVADGTDYAGADGDWALVQLVRSFPGCSRSFLKEILDDCNSDYRQAHALLARTTT